MSAEEQKQRAAEKALNFISEGMAVGLGTGSTAEYFVKALAERVRQGLAVETTATSLRTAQLAQELGLVVKELDSFTHLHVTVDGADEVDSELRLIKGGGGALLREKIVAAASDEMIVVVDEAKVVNTLGRFSLPVEVVPFGLAHTVRKIEGAALAAGCATHLARLRIRESGEAFKTDGGHFIVDCACGAIPRPEELADSLSAIPGVVDHGLFIALASKVIVGQARDTDILTK